MKILLQDLLLFPPLLPRNNHLQTTIKFDNLFRLPSRSTSPRRDSKTKGSQGGGSVYVAGASRTITAFFTYFLTSVHRRQNHHQYPNHLKTTFINQR